MTITITRTEPGYARFAIPLPALAARLGVMVETEKEGFSLSRRDKILQQLELHLKSSSSRELERLRALLVVHGFLPS